MVSITYSATLVLPPAMPGVDHHLYQDYQRMMQNIERWSPEPRYTGSDEIERVRRELLIEITSMGLVAQLDVYNSGKPKGINKYQLDENGDLIVQNIMVRLEAPQSQTTYLFVAHYDGSDDPSAGDSMFGVCAMLEALRSLAKLDLNHNIIFLFTDGEEVFRTLSGASHVLKSYPELVDEVALVLNIEGCNGGGNPGIYGSSPDNLSLLRFYQSIGLYEYGTSLIYDIMAFTDTSGDLYHFTAAGMTGLNLAAFGSGRYYHTPLDTYENLDPNSAYIYFQNVIQLAHHLAMNGSDDLKAAENGVFFPILPGKIAVIPLSATRILFAVILVISFALLLVFRRQDGLGSVEKLITRVLKFTSVSSVVFAVVFPNSLLHFVLPITALLVHFAIHRLRLAERTSTGVVLSMIWSVTSGSAIITLSAPILFQMFLYGLRMPILLIIPIGLLAYIIPCLLCLCETNTNETMPLVNAITLPKSIAEWWYRPSE
ncbi:MAG: M28 family peptidase [Symbiobacteriaceae bacterium]|nr:M28 family peptidase [Symbiobacteriaceae bacterium]